MLDKMSGVKNNDEGIDYLEEIGDSLKKKEKKKSVYLIIVILFVE